MRSYTFLLPNTFQWIFLYFLISHQSSLPINPVKTRVNQPATTHFYSSIVECISRNTASKALRLKAQSSSRRHRFSRAMCRCTVHSRPRYPPAARLLARTCFALQAVVALASRPGKHARRVEHVPALVFYTGCFPAARCCVWRRYYY